MNHPYHDNYHGGYARGEAGGMQQPGMGYGHGVYDNSSVARMGHPRHGYNPMHPQYRNSSSGGGQMHPMMQQQQQMHPGGGMYSPHGAAGYMGPMAGGSNNHYGLSQAAGGYPGYGGGGMNHPHHGNMNMNPASGVGMSRMGQTIRGQHHNSMMGGSEYYGNHPHAQHPQHPHHQQQQQQHSAAAATSPMANQQQQQQQQQTPPPNYGHQSPSGNASNSANPNSSMPPQQQQNQKTTHQATHHHHPSHPPINSSNNSLQTSNNNNNKNHSLSSIPPSTITQSHSNMPISPQAQAPNTNNNQGQHNISSSAPLNNNMMMPGSQSQSQTHTHTHTQPRPPTAGTMAMSGNGGGGAAHPIPQHPMRHPTTQQSPQEVADSILQIASSYPTNQTVQVPLKGRHAPYHIPRSPHPYNTTTSSSATTSLSSSSTDNSAASTVLASTTNSSNHFQQHTAASPPTSHQSQPSPSPSTSSGVKSPNPALAPIPNPIPSPGISGIRSPPSSHCLSPCSSQQQRSPGHMTSSSSSSFSGYNQPAPSPSYSQHYSPVSGGGTPQHHSAHSPPSSSFYPPSNNPPNFLQSSDNQSLYGNYSNHQSSSPYSGNNMISPSHTNIHSGGQYNHQHQQQQFGSNNGGGNNPLMSLQKLVMLPETQVVDPKSVVNDACLASAAANESNNADSKNCEIPAERFVESSDLSVGSSGQFSSLSVSMQSKDSSQGDKESQTVSMPSNDTTDVENTSSHTMKDAGSHMDDDAVNLTDAASKENNGENVSEIFNDKNESQDSVHVQDESKISPNSGSASSLDSQSKHNSVESDKSHVESSQKDLSDISGSLHDNNYLKSVTGSEEKVVSDDIKWEEEESFKSVSENLDVESSKEYSEKRDSIIFSLSEGQEVNCEEKEDLLEESKNSRVKKEIISPLKKDLDHHCELKQVSPESISSVLSEVQVAVNGNDVALNTEGEENKEEASEKITLPRLRNGLKSVARSKIGLTTKKASQFLRLTTPCSIAVGADEREVCEQFAFRRNGYCHALRASRLLYNGRGRQDSTSHGDSDESIENISDQSFHSLGNPQDGSKKKNVAKKNEGKKSNDGQTKTNGKQSVIGKGSGGSSGTNISNIEDSKDPQEKGMSDEEGEMSYYEGVDSSDFFMNNNSSDDSFSSSPDSKQKRQETANVSDIKQLATETEETSTVRSPGKHSRTSPAGKKDESAISHAVSNGAVSVSDILFRKNARHPRLSSKLDENSSDRENDKIKKTRVNRRKAVLGNRLITNEQPKFSEVKLEKSEFLKSSANVNKLDIIDLTEDITVVSATVEKLTADVSQEVKVENFKVETSDNVAQQKVQSSPSKSKAMPKAKRKRPPKSKQKGSNSSPVKSRDDDVKDSFKSMKFSRTLDMMKSQRKKEQNLSGPFIRVVGVRATPKKVSVINQLSQFQTASTSGKQNQKSLAKQSVSSSATMLHMISNLSSDKTALVSSTKTVSHQTSVCAFCNRQSSFRSLGDLFGPYYKSEDLPTVEQLASEEAKKMKDIDKKSEKKKPSTSKIDKKGASSSSSLSSPPSSKKRKMNVKKEVGPQEVWIHEMCALWAPGVYVIGSKLYGMDEAMKDSVDSICSSCKEKGAMVGCLHKGCAMKYHISCAIDKDCYLDEENLSLLCPKHKDKKLRISSSTSAFPLL